MSDYGQINGRDIDNHITGHYGEDQFKDCDDDAVDCLCDETPCIDHDCKCTMCHN